MVTVPLREASSLVFLLFATTAFAADAVPRAAPAAASATEVRLSVVSADPRQTVLELTVPEMSSVPLAAGRAFACQGLERTPEEGMPDLPTMTVLVGVPQRGEVRLAVSAGGTGLVSNVDVGPAPGPEGTAIAEGSAGREPAVTYRDDRFWPESPAELLSVEVIRGIRVARVRLNPVQYNPARRTASVHRQLRVTVSCSQPAFENPRPDGLDPVVRDLLVNGREAINWKLDLPRADSINFFDRSDVWCRIQTETTGVYRVSPADLRAAGFDPDEIVPATLRLYALGPHEPNGPYPDTMIEVPAYVPGEADGRFDGDDYLAFYAQSPSRWDDSMANWKPNLFTRFDCYWLTWGQGQGLRMAEVSGAGATAPRSTAANRVRLESDSLCPARSGLLWLWEEVAKPAGPFTDTLVRELALPNRDTLLALRGRLYGRCPNPRAHPKYPVVVRLNGVFLDTLTVSGEAQGPPPCDFRWDAVPAGALRPRGTPDTLAFELAGDNEADVFLDYLEVDYVEQLALSGAQPAVEFQAREQGTVEYRLAGAGGDVLLLDVTDPWRPRRVVDSEVAGGERTFRFGANGLARFHCVLSDRLRPPPAIRRRVPGGLRAAADHVHYYIIVPDEFHPSARLLAQYRQGRVPGIAGARAEAVKLGDIYDDYAFGLEEPGAIKGFFAARKPEYGLLAADGLFDYKNNLRLTGREPYVPPYEMGYDIDPEVYGVIARALDAWYADFEGGGSSPDMALGRVTCRSAVELRRFVDKVQRYEAQPPGLWTRRFILLGDDEYLGSPEEPEGFVHIVHGCEPIAAIADTLFEPVKVYLTEHPLVQENDKPGARADLKRQLDAGALLWTYFGHGAGFRLAHEQALNIEGVPEVRNGSRIPVAFYGSCGVGRFEDTRYQSIAEELVRKEDGCIATMGATKATSSPGNEAFAQALFPYLLGHPEQPIGAAFFRAWPRNTLYHFFGDPAAALRLPRQGMRPVVVPDTFYAGGGVAVANSVRAAAGQYDIVAFESEMDRYYESDLGGIMYRLLGNVIFRGGGRFSDSTVNAGFVVPRAPYPETIPAPFGNGRYTRVPNSCRVSVVAAADSGTYSSVALRIPLSREAAGSGDRQPPDVILYADGRRLNPAETTFVPKRFDMTGHVSDPSGIYLLPSPSENRLDYFFGDPSQDSSLVEYFEYDGNSSTAGRFRKQVEVQQREDSVVVTASDNMLNRRRSAWYLRTDLGERLTLDSALVFPNPSAGPTRFTFFLSRAALVSVRVYTISGRLVRHLAPQACGYGYGEVGWDGLDNDGAALANGIYLYKLDAKVTEGMSGSNQSSSASLRDKFVVRR